MGDIVNWLQALALEKYAPAFAAHEIDLDAARHLTEADLVAMGLPLGPRRKILAALQQPALPPAAPEAGERRHITVLFCDIVGSTELTGRLDPEAMREVLRAYQDAVAAELRKTGGHLAKFMGDGVLAYFGWPQASEDAAERALRAGLGLVEAVSGIISPEGGPLRIRVGIASGLVVIGGRVGAGSAQEESVAGDALNLAARLQSLALPDCVLISDATHQLVRGLFECEPQGDHSLKGFAQPLPVWRVRHEKAGADRFSSVRGRHAGFFGRKAELEFLTARWDEAIAGNFYAAVLLGEAGIGKSRLVSMLRARALAGGCSEISWQCSPHHSNNALYPVLQALEAAAAILPGDDAAAKAAKLEALLDRSGMDPGRAFALFADLLSIPLQGRYPPAEGSAAQRKAALIAALAEWIAHIARTAPLLLVLEDAHWIDATTLALMTRLVESGAAMPALALVTSRPGFAAPWRGQPRTGEIALNHLSSADSARLVQRIVAARDLQNDVIAGIVAKSDGNPLFLEELTEAVLISGAGHIPDTLQDSLMARLDAMGEAKQTAQIAAVIGRTFSIPLLAQVMDADAAMLERAISQLTAAELVYRIDRIGEETYEFKHALVCDAAYESLLKTRRRVLHERVGRTLERAFPQVAESEPELLAWHFGKAGLPEAAVRYGQRAGDRAAAQSAYAEAIANYRGALAECSQLAEGGDRDRSELALLLKLGPAQATVMGPQHVAVEETYRRAVDIARALDDVGSLFQALWGQWYNDSVTRLDSARRRADELVALSERSQDGDHILEALHCRWATAIRRGEYAVGLADSARGIAQYDSEKHHALGLAFGGHDPGVCAYTLNGTALSLSGYPDRGRRRVEEAIALAERLNHPPSLAHAFQVGLGSYCVSRDMEGTASCAARLIAVAEKYNFAPQRAMGSFFHAWSLADPAQSLAAMEAEFPRASTLAPLSAVYAALMAERLTAAGRPAEALVLLDGMLNASKTPETGYHISEVHRMRGECLAALGPARSAEAIAAIALALKIARRDGGLMLELRAAMSRLAVSPPGDRPQALAALRDLLNGFTEGFGCADLIRARALCENQGTGMPTP